MAPSEPHKPNSPTSRSRHSWAARAARNAPARTAQSRCLCSEFTPMFTLLGRESPNSQSILCRCGSPCQTCLTIPLRAGSCLWYARTGTHGARERTASLRSTPQHQTPKPNKPGFLRSHQSVRAWRTSHLGATIAMALVLSQVAQLRPTAGTIQARQQSARQTRCGRLSPTTQAFEGICRSTSYPRRPVLILSLAACSRTRD
ncbi:hypothetical protein K458DRAFT_83548 [Lentithecium fluviatile CBS 122367]|uniref:Uncharacterized protein n=1 Tax=Lentithecium fluviatile CBS 122367 TaxID=1168545 RepID=A0A6G1IT37_9PLEO|nr:hypothetical protein K458DRAFT_83548 [Lentithecium fluviatile CBS 122367]